MKGHLSILLLLGVSLALISGVHCNKYPCKARFADFFDRCLYLSVFIPNPKKTKSETQEFCRGMGSKLPNPVIDGGINKKTLLAMKAIESMFYHGDMYPKADKRPYFLDATRGSDGKFRTPSGEVVPSGNGYIDSGWEYKWYYGDSSSSDKCLALVMYTGYNPVYLEPINCSKKIDFYCEDKSNA